MRIICTIANYLSSIMEIESSCMTTIDVTCLDLFWIGFKNLKLSFSKCPARITLRILIRQTRFWMSFIGSPRLKNNHLGISRIRIATSLTIYIQFTFGHLTRIYCTHAKVVCRWLRVEGWLKYYYVGGHKVLALECT